MSHQPSSSQFHSFYNAPFGTYSKDLDLAVANAFDEEPLALHTRSAVYRSSAEGIVVKIYRQPGNQDFEPWDIERICDIMELAGDCCVATVGRAFMHSKVSGFCTPTESPVDSSNIATKKERIGIIYKLWDLVAKLHSKNIVHGDIKPDNLLLCSDGQLRLCDFDGASIEGDGYATAALSYPYCSPFRVRNDTDNTLVPMTRAEDVHAMGMTMWEIYTGRLPLTYGAESSKDKNVIELLENRSRVGFLPDMDLIDEPEIASIIQTCLDAAPQCPNTPFRDAVYCVETRLELGLCDVRPKHFSSRVVHGQWCEARTTRGDGRPCEFPFLERRILPTSPDHVDPICMTCKAFVDYGSVGQRLFVAMIIPTYQLPGYRL
ncbi:kinase-like domain-containing protein [Mycena rebaudengoi]|nr:kinase-like domain-containing protein [Mycena rebaudengoi]